MERKEILYRVRKAERKTGNLSDKLDRDKDTYLV